VRQEPRPHCFHEERSGAARGVDHLARLGGVDGGRLLGEHGLTRADREQRGVVMAGVRRWHVHGIGIRIADQSLAARVPVRYAEFVPGRVRRSPGP
jgi:hypothetical protein